jgi:DNA-binding transcriptional MerR regulator
MSKRLTVGAMSKATGLSAPTIRLYYDAGLIPGDVDTNGHRTFPPTAVAIAKAVHAERMARAGRPVRADAA